MADPKKALEELKRKYTPSFSREETKPSQGNKGSQTSQSAGQPERRDPKAALENIKKKYNQGAYTAASKNTATLGSTTQKKSYYSQPELWKDKDRLHKAITDAEPTFLAKQKQMEQAAKDLESWAAKAKLTPNDQRVVDGYNAAHDAYTKLWAEYEPLQKTYNDAVNAYNAYVEDQNSQYNDWKSTIRSSEEIDAALKALDEELEKATRVKSAYNVASKYSEDDLTEKVLSSSKDLSELEKQRALLVEEREWADHFSYADRMDDADFKEYSAKGGAIENPSVKDANGKINLFGWRPGAEDVGNIVTYSRDNLDSIKNAEKNALIQKAINLASGNKLGTSPSSVGDSIYGYMTEDEVAIYNYLLAKEGEGSAKEYLDHLADYLNMREGTEIGETVRGIDSKVLRDIASTGYGVVAGVDQFVSGAKQFLSPEELPTSSLQYGSQYIQEDIGDKGVMPYVYGAATTIGNMAPSILASTVTGGLGASAGLAQTVGAATMGVSAAGNAYKQKLAEGYSKSQARTYSTLVGISEGALQRVLGGIGSLGGVTDDILLAKVRAVDNAFARVALTGAVKIGSEIAEEELQNFLEPYIASVVFNESYDAPTVEELVETAIVTALSTGVLEGGNIVSAGGKKTADLGAKVNLGNEEVQAIIEEGLAADPKSTSYALAKQLQKDLEKGKTISNQALGALQQANMENVDSESDPDQALAEAASETVAREMGVEAPESAQESVSPADVKVGKVSQAQAGGQSVPYNVMSVNNQARKAVTNPGYGEVGTRTFAEIVEESGQSPDHVRTQFQTAYELGKLEMPREKVHFESTIQESAYNAGRQDAILSMKKAEIKGATVWGKEGGLIQNEYSAKLDKRTTDTLQKIGKATGTKIIIEAIPAELNANGYYRDSDGTIHIDSNTTQPVMTVVKHELTHRMQSLAPKEYTQFRNYAVQVMSEKGWGVYGSNTAVEAMQHEYAKRSDGRVQLSVEDAMDEIAANFTGKILTDEKALNDFVSHVTKNAEHRTMGQKFFQAVREFIDKVKRIFKGDKAKMDDAARDEFGATIDQLEKAEQLWKEAYRAAEKTANETGRAGETRDTMSYSLKEESQRGEAKDENRRAFLERSRRGARKSGEAGDAVYAYTPASWDETNTKARQVQEELTLLGIDSFFHSGLEVNENGKTLTAGDVASAISDKVVGIYYRVFGVSKEVAGHEAYHIWTNAPERSEYTKIFRESMIGFFESAYALQQALEVESLYFTGAKIDKAEFFEEYIARLSGQIHSGEHESDLRTAFKDYDAVKAAWQALVKSQAKDYQFSLKEGQKQLTEAEEFSDLLTQFSLREKEPPKKVGVAYKVFFAKDGQLYPPMVANPGGEGTPVGVWLDADVAASAAPSKTGRPQVQAGGKGTNAGKMSLAFRPGWHLGDLPMATQFARKNPETGVKDLFPADFVWAECEYAMDHDYQEEAMSYGYTENGKFRHSYAGLPRLPEDGYYRYRTNPNPDTVPWVITGAMRVKRILTDAETDKILRDAGVEPMKRQGGKLDLEKLGLRAGEQYSLKDSTGKELTQEQAEYFQDSKVRDEQGNLLVVYHGTRKGGFTIFRDWAYLTASKGYAKRYADNNTGETVYEVYANITKPFDTRLKECRDLWRKEFFGSYSRTELQDTGLPDWTDGYDLAEWIEENGYDFDGILLDEGADYDQNGNVKERGISYVVRSSEQIKNVSNKQPTDDPDIRFSMKSSRESDKNLIAIHNKNAEAILAALDLGGFPMPSIAIVKDNMGHEKFGDISILFRKDTISPTDRRNKVYGADAWTPTRPQVGYKVSEKARQRIETKVEELAGRELMREYRLMLDDTNVDDSMNRWDGDFKRAYSNNEAMKAAFLKAKGIPFKPVMKDHKYNGTLSNDALRKIVQEIGATRIIEAQRGASDAIMQFEPIVRKYYNEQMEKDFGGTRFLDKMLVDEVPWAKVETILRDAISFFKGGAKKVIDSNATKDRIEKKFTKKMQQEYDAWLDELSDGIIEKKGLRNNKDLFTPSGNRRSFEQLYMAYNLDNIVEAMKGDSEKGAGLFGTGNIFGAATKEYGSIAEIKADSDRLVMEDDETHSAAHEAFSDRLAEITRRMLKPGDDRFGATLDAGDAAVESLLKGKTVAGIQRELKSWHRFNATKEIAQDIYDLAQEIANAPTTYFEAKPRRAVGFDEVAAVVMPRAGNAELKARLENMGIQVLTYNPNKEGDRLKKINSVDGIKFSLKEQTDIMRDNAKLKEVNAALREQLKTTKFAKVDQKELRAFARKLLKDYTSDADLDETLSKLDNLYTFLANDDPAAVAATQDQALESLANSKDEFSQPSKWSTAYRMAYNIAEGVIQDASVLNDDMYVEYEDLRKRLRSTGLSISKEYEHDLPGYEDLNDFRKRNFGRIKMTKDGLDVNTAYQELASTYPGLFDEYTYSHPADQLVHIAEVLDSMEPIEENPFSYNMREATSWLANDIMERFFELPQAKPTFADKAQRKLTEQVIHDAKKLERLRQSKNERTAKIIAEYREKVKETRKQEKAAKWEAVGKIKDHYKAKEAKMSESRKAAVLRERITRHAAELKQKLLKPTDKKHIPQELQGAVAKLLECINQESKYEYAMGEDGLFHRVERGTVPDAEPAKRTQAFAELQSVYAQLVNELTIDPDLMGDDGLLNDVIKLADKPLATMTSEELRIVWDTLRAVEASVRTANKMHAASRWLTVAEAAEDLLEDNKEKKDKVELRGILGKGQKLTGLEMETPETYFHMLGNAGDKLFRMMRNAQDEHIRLMKDVADFTHKALKDVDVRKLESEMHSVMLGGESVKLSTAQIMELYVLTKREQALDHIFVGGILPDVVSAKGLKKITKASPVRGITMEDVGKVVSKLTDDQRKIAEQLQEFASTKLGKWGNQASMKVYGYEKFGEKNYWPIRVNRQEVKSDIQKDTAVTSLANRSFTKGTRPHANNSLRLGSIFDTFSTHSSEMATYAAWLGTLEDINRVRNFSFKDEESGHVVDTVKSLIDTVHGTSGQAYLDKLLADVTNGVKGTHGETNYMSGLVGNFKAAAVGANLRVIIQQPTAMLRAADMIGAQYMASPGNPLNGWKKAKKYAPIAQWKDWGYFDINTGRQMKDVLFDSDTALDKAKNISMWGAGAMDSLAWGQLWNAVEAETKAKREDLKPGTEAFYEAVGQRFTEIVDHTQVVDGILQRSQIMRSADGITKMATSFMGEPTKQYNMMMQAAYDARHIKGDKRKAAMKRLARTGVVLAISGLANAMAQSIIDAVRDDEKEKKYWEKWLASFWDNLGGTFNPVGYVPFAKDILSILQGYDVTRMDMESIEKLVSAGQNMIKALGGEGKHTIGGAAINLIAEVARLVGIPVSNLKREITSFAMTAAIQTDNYLMQYRMEKWLLAMNNSSNRGTFMDILYNAYMNDKEAYEIIYADMIKEDKFKTEDATTADAIANAMENRMKKSQGVEKVKDLEQRYFSPDQQPKYDDLMASVQKSRLWSSATEKQQKNLEEMAYTYIAGDSKTAQELAEDIADAKTYGIDETEYLLYELALEMYDTRNKSGELGGPPTNAEKATAIQAMGNLSDREIAFLWDTEKGYEAYAAGVDMGAYVDYLGNDGTVSLDKMIAAQDYGISTTQYLDFLDMLDKYDQPSESGKYGSFTQDEATAAIAAMTGLTGEQRAHLWQSVNKGWKSKNNPWK